MIVMLAALMSWPALAAPNFSPTPCATILLEERLSKDTEILISHYVDRNFVNKNYLYVVESELQALTERWSVKQTVHGAAKDINKDLELVSGRIALRMLTGIEIPLSEMRELLPLSEDNPRLKARLTKAASTPAGVPTELHMLQVLHIWGQSAERDPDWSVKEMMRLLALSQQIRPQLLEMTMFELGRRQDWQLRVGNNRPDLIEYFVKEVVHHHAPDPAARHAIAFADRNYFDPRRFQFGEHQAPLCSPHAGKAVCALMDLAMHEMETLVRLTTNNWYVHGPLQLEDPKIYKLERRRIFGLRD